MLLGEKSKLVIMIVGPTGVGKTGLAIELSKAIGGEIISADSRSLYRGMDIGTATPSIGERAGIPHYLIDTADPDDTWSLAVYLEKTVQLVDDLVSKNKVPIIVGGTGQYMRALKEGWRIPAFETDENLRNILHNWSEVIGKAEIHHKLSVIDAEAARIIDPSNVRRTIRALEVIFSTGQRFSTLRVKDGPAYEYWIIGLTLPREQLFERIDARIDEMFRRGLIQEVKQLLEKGYGPDLPSMSAIGYREVTRYLNGEIEFEAARDQMKNRTRQFVRRQANWFKPDDKTIHWYSMEKDPIPEILKDLSELTRINVQHEC
jgi:tRNA dimethylallyltransferase